MGRAILWLALFALLLTQCARMSTPATPTPHTEIDLTPFKEMASRGPCADIRNRLFLIDGQLVLWDTAGHCADAAYAQWLFGSTVDARLCGFHDSIAGPIKTCQDERYREIFDTMIANLDKPDLGLGPKHQVQLIPFP